jgi:hypothetical protein
MSRLAAGALALRRGDLDAGDLTMTTNPIISETLFA